MMRGQGLRPQGRAMRPGSPGGRGGRRVKDRKVRRSSQRRGSVEAAQAETAQVRVQAALARSRCPAQQPVAIQVAWGGALVAPALTATAQRLAGRWWVVVQGGWWGRVPSRSALTMEATATTALVAKRPSRRRSWRREWRNRLLRGAPCRWRVAVASGGGRRRGETAPLNSRSLARGGYTGGSRPQRRKSHREGKGREALKKWR